MKKYICISLLILHTSFFIEVTAQDKKIESLDSFFAGVPLQQTFEKWVDHISNNPFLGIDSIRERGMYSSFKKGKPGNFPFPEHIAVKILFNEEVVKLYNQKLKWDTVKAIMIEGVFENSRQGEKESNIFYEVLKKTLTPYYEKSKRWEQGLDLSNGISSRFPDCMITKGYSLIHAFNYVIIVFVDGKKIKDISPLKMSKGY